MTDSSIATQPYSSVHSFILRCYYHYCMFMYSLFISFLSLVIMPEKQAVQIRTRKLIKNNLLARRQFVIDVAHPGVANVSKSELQSKVAEMFKVKEKNCVILFGFRTVFGGGRSSGFCLIYNSWDEALKYEPKYRIARVTEKKNKSSRKQIKEKKNRDKKVFGVGRRIAKHKAKKAASS